MRLRFVIHLVLLCGLFSLAVETSSAGTVAEEFVSAHKDFFHLLAPEKTDIRLSALYQPENDEEDGPGEFDLTDYEASLEFARPFSRDTFIHTLAEYEARYYEFERVSGATTSASTELLHKISLGIGFGHFFTRNLLFDALVMPGLYTDFDKSIDEDDFQLHSEGLLVYRINPATQFFAGVAYDETFDDWPVLPIAGISILSEDGRLHIRLKAPLEGRLGYNISPDLQFYGGYWISGDKYRVNLGRQDEEFDVQVHDRRAGGGLIYWLNDRFSVGLEGGVSVQSEMEFKLANAGQFSGDLDPAPYVQGALGFSF